MSPLTIAPLLTRSEQKLQNRLGKPHLRTLHGRVGGAAIFFAIGAPLLGALAFRAIGLTARLPAVWQPRVKSTHRVVRRRAERERERERGEGGGESKRKEGKDRAGISTGDLTGGGKLNSFFQIKQNITTTRSAPPRGLSPSWPRCWGSLTRQLTRYEKRDREQERKGEGRPE